MLSNFRNSTAVYNIFHLSGTLYQAILQTFYPLLISAELSYIINFTRSDTSIIIVLLVLPTYHITRVHCFQTLPTSLYSQLLPLSRLAASPN